jgi:hypothetical protein
MEKNRDLVAYCGLYCGDCPGYKGEIADLARDLKKKLREEKFDRAAEWLSEAVEPFKKYEDFDEVLGAMVTLRCRRQCRQKGVRTSCEVRKCCQKRNFAGCWECEEFETCDKFDFLKPVHEDACLKNLRKIKKQGLDKFIEGKRYW